MPNWGPQLPWQQVLEEMSQAGYEGTELGPWGYFPSDRELLAETLQKYGLAMASAFCPINLHGHALDQGEMDSLRAEAALLASLGATDIIIADSGSPNRSLISGRVKQEANGDALGPDDWQRLRGYMEQVCEVVLPLGLRPCLHPHAGTYIETDEEIERFMEAVTGLPVGLCLDTGHLAYAGADPVAIAEMYKDHIQYCHLKDIDLAKLNACLTQKLDYDQTAKADVFVPLGKGDVAFSALFDVLRSANYEGWLVVEQDRVYHPGTDMLGDSVLSREFIRQTLGV